MHVCGAPQYSELAAIWFPSFSRSPFSLDPGLTAVRRMHRRGCLHAQKAWWGLHFQHRERDRIGGHKGCCGHGTVAICGIEKEGGGRVRRQCKLSVEFSEWSRGGERGLLGPQQETSPWTLCWVSFLFLIAVTIVDKSSSWKEGSFWLTVWRCIMAGKAGQQGHKALVWSLIG